MKLLALMLSLYSVSAFANFIEVECEGKSQNKEISLEIEQPFPRGSFYRRAEVVVTEDGAETARSYQVSSRISRGMPTIHYTGAGIRLEVDLWPDQAPRWGRDYRATLYSSLVDRKTLKVECRFPNAL